MSNISNSWKNEAFNRVELSEVEFNKWFDDCKTEHELVANATVDFYHRIFTPKLYSYVKDPRDKHVLEIGYGGGRLLNAALNVFAQATGVDIHDDNVKQRVEKILEHHGNRFKLLHRNDISLIENNSIDFAYSFIVFQHFDGLDECKMYLDLFSRSLKTGGLVKIFYIQSSAETHVDMIAFEQSSRAETLRISHNEMEKMCSECNLKIVEHVQAGPKKVWDPMGSRSSQHVVTCVKS